MSIRVESYIEEEVAMPALSEEEGAKAQEVEGQTAQPVQTLGPSRQGMEG